MPNGVLNRLDPPRRVQIVETRDDPQVGGWLHLEKGNAVAEWLIDGKLYILVQLDNAMVAEMVKQKVKLPENCPDLTKAIPPGNLRNI